ncbi:MAG: ATP-binding protein [Pseudomonadota bacterium]
MISAQAQELKISVDERDYVTSADDGVTTLLGRNAAQVAGRYFGDLVRLPGDIPFAALRLRYPQTSFRFAAHLRNAKGGELYCRCVANKDGTQSSITLIYDPLDVPNALIEELVTKDGHFSHALSVVKVGYWIWHIQSQRIVWSDECFYMMGLVPGRDQPAMEPYMAAIHPEDRDYVQQNVGQVMQAGQAPDMEYRLVRSDGSIIYVTSRAELIKDSTGQPTYLFGTLQDVTQQKEYENALKQAKSAAEQANLAKTKFLSRVSHEFRTPLNAVVGNAELLRLEAGSQYQEYLGDLLEGCQQIESMLMDALDITGVDQIALQMEPVDLVRIVEDLAQSTQSIQARYQVRLRVGKAKISPLFIHSDAKRVRQVLLNLASNAIKYNKPGGAVNVDLRTEADHVHIDVRDTGLGIAPENYAKIFQPFERIVVHENVLPGTGLGLTLSRELAKVLGGNICFTSELGVGSCFTLTLPM